MQSPGVATRTAFLRAGHHVDRVWALIAITIPAVASFAVRLDAIDLAYQVRAGDLMLRTGHLLRTDPFTFSATAVPWRNQQWLAQLLLALPFRLGGWPTLAFLRGVLIALMLALLLLACRERGASLRTAALLSITGFFLCLPSLALRPQLFGIVFFAGSIWILASSKGRPRRLWALPLIAVAWANLHGSFALLPLLIGLEWLRSMSDRDGRARRLGVVGVLCAGATVLNPLGLGVWSYIWTISTNPVVRNQVTEWRPMGLSDAFGWAFFGSAVAVALYLLWRHSYAWVDVVWLLAFFAIALPAERGLAWWGLIVPFVLAGTMPHETSRSSDGGGFRIVDRALVVCVCAAGLLLLPWWRGIDPATGSWTGLKNAPQQLVEIVDGESTPGAHVFVPQQFASWFEYALPGKPVFVDSRIEVEPPRVWAEYDRVVSGKDDWAAILDRYRVDVVLTMIEWPLTQDLRDDPRWLLVHEDADGAVFVRG